MYKRPLLSWIIGKKTTKDETEFMVGGREFTAFMTAIGNGSILISGGYLPSIIMYGYMFGMGGMWFYLGWGTGALVAWLCWAGFWRTSGALTPTEWFEYRYGKGGRMAITIVIPVSYTHLQIQMVCDLVPTAVTTGKVAARCVADRDVLNKETGFTFI